jgi:Bacterial protein of unknown function (DUF916)
MISNEVPLKRDRLVADIRRVRRSTLSLIAAVILCCLTAGTAVAEPGEASFALNPVHYDPALRTTKSYFVAVARPGTTVENSVRVVNTGTREGTAYLYSVDATTGQTSGAVYFDRRIARRGVGAWISMNASSLTLGPKQSKVVSFVVHVPASAHPGDHLGGIVAENSRVQQSSGKGALQIRIRHLTIVAVEVQVPGAAQARLQATGVHAGGEHGYQYVYVRLANSGPLTMKPSGRLLISNADGKQVASRPLQLDTFLPQTAIDYPVLLPARALDPGKYRATVDLTYGASALGYRRADGPSYSLSRSFGFTVSSSQYTTVFKGVAPVARPGATVPAPAKSSTPMLFWLVVVLAALLAFMVVFVVGMRRWPAR